MPYTKASMKASNKWMKNNYDKILVTVKKGQKDVWKKAAEEKGLSLNAFIRQAVEKEL